MGRGTPCAPPAVREPPKLGLLWAFAARKEWRALPSPTGAHGSTRRLRPPARAFFGFCANGLLLPWIADCIAVCLTINGEGAKKNPAVAGASIARSTPM